MPSVVSHIHPQNNYNAPLSGTLKRQTRQCNWKQMNEWNFSLEVIPAPVNFLTYTFACKVSRYSKTRNIGLIIKETHVETKGILKIKFIRNDTHFLIMTTFRFLTTLLSRRQLEFNQFWISSVGIRRRDVKTRSQKLIYIIGRLIILSIAHQRKTYMDTTFKEL